MPPTADRVRPPPLAPITVPSTPHLLPPTVILILPVFVRPVQPSQTSEFKWGPEPILRGNSEKLVLGVAKRVTISGEVSLWSQEKRTRSVTLRG